jgi:stage IV sporulation protein FB
VTFDLFGFPVTLQNGMFVLAGVYLLLGVQDRTPVPEVVGGVLAIFGSILWHELGHAFAARNFGLGPIAITLHGFGGTTRHLRADKPWKELIVTLSGPGNGLLLGVVAVIAAMYVHDGVGGAIIERLVFVNVFWSLFNLLPMFPLDGGNALLSFLRIVAPGIAYPVVIGLGLLLGVLLAAGAIALTMSGVGTALFLLMLAGTAVQSNWALWTAWSDARARGAG